MAENVEQSSARGLTRRQLIKASAVAGAAVWTAPVIVDSLSSPAAAGSICPPGTSGLSYYYVVYEKGGVYYSLKYDGSCSSSNDVNGSSDGCLSQVCGSGASAITFSNPGNTLSYQPSGGIVTATTPGVCGNGDIVFSNGGAHMTAGPGVNIVFAFAHDGSFSHPCKLGAFFCATGPCAAVTK